MLPKSVTDRRTQIYLLGMNKIAIENPTFLLKTHRLTVGTCSHLGCRRRGEGAGLGAGCRGEVGGGGGGGAAGRREVGGAVGETDENNCLYPARKDGLNI